MSEALGPAATRSPTRREALDALFGALDGCNCAGFEAGLDCFAEHDKFRWVEV